MKKKLDLSYSYKLDENENLVVNFKNKLVEISGQKWVLNNQPTKCLSANKTNYYFKCTNYAKGCLSKCSIHYFHDSKIAQVFFNKLKHNHLA